MLYVDGMGRMDAWVLCHRSSKNTFSANKKWSYILFPETIFLGTKK